MKDLELAHPTSEMWEKNINDPIKYSRCKSTYLHAFYSISGIALYFSLYFYSIKCRFSEENDYMKID